MSRSKRLPYIKDKGMTTEEYWGSIRRIWKQQMRSINFWDEDFNFKLPKEIHNDWNYRDWILTPYMNKRYWSMSNEQKIKYSRK